MLTYRDSAGSALYAAGVGNETLDASGSASNMTIIGAASSTNGSGFNESLVGGSGADSFYAGTGSDTMVGHSQNNVFSFAKSVIANLAPQDFISGFQGNNSVFLSGYGSGAAATALQNATSAGGNTTLTLADNTKITFMGVSSASQLSGHVVSF